VWTWLVIAFVFANVAIVNMWDNMAVNFALSGSPVGTQVLGDLVSTAGASKADVL
jgi:hypothetical protein